MPYINGSAFASTRLGVVRARRYDNASTWEDPYTQSIKIPEASQEGMHMYKDPRGGYHCLMHAFPRKAYKNILPGGHAFSPDGRNWTYTGVAYNNTVHFSDGTSQAMCRRERPALLYASGVPSQGPPIALFNGVMPGKEGKECKVCGYHGGCDYSYSAITPLNT